MQYKHSKKCLNIRVARRFSWDSCDFFYVSSKKPHVKLFNQNAQMSKQLIRSTNLVLLYKVDDAIVFRWEILGNDNWGHGTLNVYGKGSRS